MDGDFEFVDQHLDLLANVVEIDLSLHDTELVGPDHDFSLSEACSPLISLSSIARTSKAKQTHCCECRARCLEQRDRATSNRTLLMITKSTHKCVTASERCVHGKRVRECHAKEKNQTVDGKLLAALGRDHRVVLFALLSVWFATQE